MLTLMMFPKAFGLYSASPFCVKAAYLMQLSGHTRQRQDMNDPRRMPHGKLPVLRTPERLVPDSEGIRTWLETQGADFDRVLTDAQRAGARALIHMAEDHLYSFLVLDRWGDDAVWAIIRDKFLVRSRACCAHRSPIGSGRRCCAASTFRAWAGFPKQSGATGSSAVSQR